MRSAQMAQQISWSFKQWLMALHRGPPEGWAPQKRAHPSTRRCRFAGFHLQRTHAARVIFFVIIAWCTCASAATGQQGGARVQAQHAHGPQVLPAHRGARQGPTFGEIQGTGSSSSWNLYPQEHQHAQALTGGNIKGVSSGRGGGRQLLQAPTWQWASSATVGGTAYTQLTNTPNTLASGEFNAGTCMGRGCARRLAPPGMTLRP